MTFYQELQLGQAGSKNLIRACETPRDRLLHTLIYLFKIALTVGFCFCFVTLYSMAFGSANSIVGVVVLLYLLVFRAADLCLHIGQSTALLASFLVLSAAAPHLAHLAGPLPGFFINLASIAFLILFGCHEPRMFNQSTLVLGYLLLYGYDVSGRDFTLRLAGIAFGALLVCTVFLCRHRGRSIPLRIRDIPVAFSLHHPRSRWQLCQIFCVPLVVLLAELAGLPRAMWAGIAAMSVILPAAAFIGVIGGIGVGLSAKYGWQAVFNTFGALAIAAEAYGLKAALGLRLLQNVFGVLFALVFCLLFSRILARFSAPAENS